MHHPPSPGPRLRRAAPAATTVALWVLLSGCSSHPAARSEGYDVVAAADGVVVSAQDGHYDRCTTCSAGVDSRCGLGFGGGFGNHVVINHGSYRVIYAHMRQGSVRVSVGDTVGCGDPIGQIGSSGCTTGAHVHFETRPLGGAPSSAFDPLAGGCSPTSPSRWTSQGPHRGLPAPTCDGTPTCPLGTYAFWTCDAARDADSGAPNTHAPRPNPVPRGNQCTTDPSSDNL